MKIDAELEKYLRDGYKVIVADGDGTRTYTAADLPPAEESNDPLIAAAATLTEDELQTCPACGLHEPHWLQEVGEKTSWQPFSLAVDPVRGLVEADYESSEESDDTEIDHFECRHCMAEWDDLSHIVQSIIVARALAADSEKLGDRSRLSTKSRALAVIVLTREIREWLTIHDPMALLQARTALGLVNPNEGGET